MDFRVFSRNISENMHARCVREDTKQALKGNLQADGVQSHQTLFVRYCLKLFPVYYSHGLKNPPIPLDWFYLFLTCNSLLQVFFYTDAEKTAEKRKRHFEMKCLFLGAEGGI